MTLVIAHRGASAYEKENTLAAFREAVRMGAHGIELDVHGSADGVLVVYHDAHIDDTFIPSITYDDLVTRLADPPPTLTASLDVIGAETTVYIELKTLHGQHDDALLAVIDAAPAPDRCQVHAFDHRIVTRVLNKRPGLIGGVLSASYPLDPITPIVASGASVLWQQGTLIDKQLVDQVHGAGRTIIAWTVDDPTQMQYLQTLGVDGICSNKPDVAREVLK